MAKIAELPNGKRLEFPDEVSDRVMQRVARRELGVAPADNDDLLDCFKKAADELREESKAQNNRHKELVKKIEDTFADVRKSFAVAAREQDILSLGVRQAATKQAEIMTKLYVAIDSLNRTLDAAMGQSLDALDKGRETNSRSVAEMSSVLKGLRDLVAGMRETVATMHAVASMKRRAVRERNGVWTLEPDHRVN